MNKLLRILTIFPVFPVFFCSSCNTTTKTDYESYGEILAECIGERDFHSQLYIFPKSTEGLEVTKFVYAHREDLFTGSFLMYLGIKWDEEDFKSELERLGNVKAVYKTGEIKEVIKYEKEGMYLTVNKDNRYEYALYNKESFEITYVSNQLFEWQDTPVTEEHIMPQVRIPSEIDDGENTYNIYYLYGDNVGIEVVD